MQDKHLIYDLRILADEMNRLGAEWAEKTLREAADELERYWHAERDTKSPQTLEGVTVAIHVPPPIEAAKEKS